MRVDLFGPPRPNLLTVPAFGKPRKIRGRIHSVGDYQDPGADFGAPPLSFGDDYPDSFDDAGNPGLIQPQPPQITAPIAKAIVGIPFDLSGKLMPGANGVGFTGLLAMPDLKLSLGGQLTRGGTLKKPSYQASLRVNQVSGYQRLRGVGSLFDDEGGGVNSDPFSTGEYDYLPVPGFSNDVSFGELPPLLDIGQFQGPGLPDHGEVLGPTLDELGLGANTDPFSMGEFTDSSQNGGGTDILGTIGSVYQAGTGLLGSIGLGVDLTKILRGENPIVTKPGTGTAGGTQTGTGSGSGKPTSQGGAGAGLLLLGAALLFMGSKRK